MRVALVAYALGMGGVGRFLLDLGRGLASNGRAVDIITTEERGGWFDLARERGLGALFVAGRESRSDVAHARRVAALLDGYDAVFVNHARHAQLVLGSLPEGTLRAPILHGTNAALVRLATSNPTCWNCLVAPSPELARRAEALVPGRPVRVVPHGVAIPERTAPDPRMASAAFRLVFVGRLDAAKGVRLLPEILEGLCARGVPATLDVIGDGPERDALRAGPALRLLGSLPPDQVAARVAQCHALLLPTRAEGLPLAVLEAQAAGCVPLATRLPGVTDFALEDGRTGHLLPPGDPAGYVEALAALTGDRARWQEMSEAGRRLVEARFSLPAMVAGYERILEEHARGGLPLPAERGGGGAGLDRKMLRVWDFLPAALRRPLLGAREALRRRPREAE